MARHREFDETAALDRALGVFWAKGYVATSVSDLVAATGVNRASLYGTFGDKHALFLRAVERYRSTVVARRLAHLVEGPGAPLERIEDFLEELIDFSLGEGRLLGCFMTNTAVERSACDAEAAKQVRANLAEMTAAFEAALAQARASDAIPADSDPAALAEFLTATVQGLRITARALPDRDRLERIAALALGTLRGGAGPIHSQASSDMKED